MSSSISEAQVLSGLLLVDKPSGPTSHDIVMKARKSLRTKKIGHTGTLDPLASGLLVLCVGRATKLIKYLTFHDKAYQAKVILGLVTDTDDITGHPLSEADPLGLTDAEIIGALNGFVGRSLQKPPIYSAIKVKGRKLYEYARNDNSVPEIAARAIEITAINDISIARDEVNRRIEVGFSCRVSKGTYIRALARDLGTSLDNYGTLAELRRTDVGCLSQKDAVTLPELELGGFQLIDPLDTLKMPSLILPDEALMKVSNGGTLPKSLFESLTDTIIRDKQDRPIAIYRYDQEKDLMRMSVKLV